MKRIIAGAFAGALIFAGAASAASPTQRIATLEKQVKALTATVNKQQKTLTCLLTINKKCQSAQKVASTLDTAVNVALAYELCLTGVTADAIQSTWVTLDQAGGTSLLPAADDQRRGHVQRAPDHAPGDPCSSEPVGLQRADRALQPADGELLQAGVDASAAAMSKKSSKGS